MVLVVQLQVIGDSGGDGNHWAQVAGRYPVVPTADSPVSKLGGRRGEAVLGLEGDGTERGSRRVRHLLVPAIEGGASRRSS